MRAKTGGETATEPIDDVRILDDTLDAALRAEVDIGTLRGPLASIVNKLRREDGSLDWMSYTAEERAQILNAAAVYGLWSTSQERPSEITRLVYGSSTSTQLSPTEKIVAVRESVPAPVDIESVIGEAFKSPTVRHVIDGLHEMPGIDTAGRVHF